MSPLGLLEVVRVYEVVIINTFSTIRVFSRWVCIADRVAIGVCIRLPSLHNVRVE